jgi:hypothetical protein
VSSYYVPFEVRLGTISWTVKTAGPRILKWPSQIEQHAVGKSVIRKIWKKSGAIWWPTNMYEISENRADGLVLSMWDMLSSRGNVLNKVSQLEDPRFQERPKQLHGPGFWSKTERNMCHFTLLSCIAVQQGSWWVLRPETWCSVNKVLNLVTHRV